MVSVKNHIVINQLIPACTQLRGVGPTTAARLAKLGITTILDVLLHLPIRYEDRTALTPFHQIRDGEPALVMGRVEKCVLQFGRRPTLLVHITEETRTLVIRFFQFNARQKEIIQAHVGQLMRCYGMVRLVGRRLEMMHPEYWLLQDEQEYPIAQTLTPVYPSTEGISQRMWQRLVPAALEWLTENNRDANGIDNLWQDMPEQTSTAWQFANALCYIHQPPQEADIVQLLSGIHPAQQRLAFEELLAHHLSLRKLKHQLQQLIAPECCVSDHDYQNFLDTLPFQLTGAQTRVTASIRAEMAHNNPMLRLVQGDVGCGKTVVAAVAALFAISNGWQVAMMAPTELLAHQHAQTLARFFAQQQWVQGVLQPITVVELTGRLSQKKINEIRTMIQMQQAHIVIGTHALFQKEIEFPKLGLVIVDEQHRFGVAQRMALWKKGDAHDHVPHQLMMTATPIPRTLAMTLYADIAYSVIDELPPNRKPITTVMINNQRRQEVIDRIRVSVAENKQVYWVCTQITESDTMNCQAAEQALTDLQSQLQHVRCALVHGKMKNEEKHAVMLAFKAGDIHVLVATTVIEVGVDVPNASLMIIENAERLGLAQLHQLRGRVGRGEQLSFCVLLYEAPLTEIAQSRLLAMRASQDGFVLAQKDLELRGPGELLGVKQTGVLQFKIADMLRDQHLLPHISASADTLLTADTTDADALIQRWLGDDVDCIMA
jgi:ATP-dependent DNA helicase RecG